VTILNHLRKDHNLRNYQGHLIELRGVSKEYKSGDQSFLALRDVSLTVDAGEFIAIVGKSGSGKSTLVNMVTGIDRPTRGEIIIGGIAVHKLSEDKLALWRGKTIGVIFQFFQLLPTLTLLENVMLPMDFCDVHPVRARKEHALHLLSLVDIADNAYKLPSAISGGQQQRAAIARALANDPSILIADEPTGNLDSQTANSVFDLFNRIVASGKTVLMVTHDRDLSSRISRSITVIDGNIASDDAVSI